MMKKEALDVVGRHPFPTNYAEASRGATPTRLILLTVMDRPQTAIWLR